jgi:hypothetical protein
LFFIGHIRRGDDPRSAPSKGDLMLHGLAFCLAIPASTIAGTPQEITHAPISSTQRAAQPEPHTLRFAIVGDFGIAGPSEASVASAIASWNPELVITVGDNNYYDGAADTIDANIGQYYHAFIHPYAGTFGAGSNVNRFFPSLGNHDWVTAGAVPYLAYFTLPGNERYYDFVNGPVHFFAVDSDPHEPDGITATSVQASWLHAALAASQSPFNIVYFHHPAFSSGAHGATPELQWPFRAWGADLVLTGHDHDYERISIDGFPYVVDGLGGQAISGFGGTFVPGSAAHFDGDFGAMIADANETLLTLRFITQGGAVMDQFALVPNGAHYPQSALIAQGSAWKYEDDGSNLATAWRSTSFDDSSWASGPAQLGYGDGDEATVVSFGPDSNHKYVTTYFRRAFQVASPAALQRLHLDLLRDDGAVVYFNGVEVFRSNMPSGTILYDTPASTAVGGADESTFFGIDLPTSVLVAGTNIAAVEVHQQSGTSSDVSFDLALTATVDGTKLSARGATWKYRDNGVYPGAAWKDPGYDDSAWSSGPAQLGYGDGDEATVVGYGPDPNAKYVSTWFRRSFSVAQAAQYAALALRLLCDDGAVVYLNGAEIYRVNLPYSGLTASSLAAFAVGGADESFFSETFIDPRLLVDGTNVLAVEIHQSSPTSSDISFDLELVGL